MKWNLTNAQANRLFKAGENELDAKFNEAMAADAGRVVRWGNTDDPESGSAQLELQDNQETPFLLTGEGRVYEELLGSAGIIFVPRALVEALMSNKSIVDAYCDPNSKVGAEIGVLKISIKGWGLPLPLKVCDHGEMYVELP